MIGWQINKFLKFAVSTYENNSIFWIQEKNSLQTKLRVFQHSGKIYCVKVSIRRMEEFIKGIGIDIPWYITAFYLVYKLSGVIPTSEESLQKARKISKNARTRYV